LVFFAIVVQDVLGLKTVDEVRKNDGQSGNAEKELIGSELENGTQRQQKVFLVKLFIVNFSQATNLFVFCISLFVIFIYFLNTNIIHFI